MKSEFDMSKNTKPDFRAIFDEARAAAQKAADDIIESIGKENWGMCGFVNIKFPVARGKFITWLKTERLAEAERNRENGITLSENAAFGRSPSLYGSKYHPTGWNMSITPHVKFGGNSFYVYAVAAQAFVDVLQSHGIDCHIWSRVAD